MIIMYDSIFFYVCKRREGEWELGVVVTIPKSSDYIILCIYLYIELSIRNVYYKHETWTIFMICLCELHNNKKKHVVASTSCVFITHKYSLIHTQIHRRKCRAKAHFPLVTVVVSISISIRKFTLYFFYWEIDIISLSIL